MFLELIRNRRSIRRFEDRPVPADLIDVLLEAALRAPSSRSLYPWDFIVVTDPGRLTALSRVKPHGAAFLAGAPLGIVITADPKRCDVWIEDCAISAIFIQLAATDLGLGSCWIQLRKRNHIGGEPAGTHAARLLGIPEDREVAFIIAVGFPSETLAGHPEESLLIDRVHRETFGQPNVPSA